MQRKTEVIEGNSEKAAIPQTGDFQTHAPHPVWATSVGPLRRESLDRRPLIRHSCIPHGSSYLPVDLALSSHGVSVTHVPAHLRAGQRLPMSRHAEPSTDDTAKLNVLRGEENILQYSGSYCRFYRTSGVFFSFVSVTQKLSGDPASWSRRSS